MAARRVWRDDGVYEGLPRLWAALEALDDAYKPKLVVQRPGY